MRGIFDVFAQHERALIRAGTRAALAVKRARGERIGSIPFGYSLAEDGFTLKPNPVEQQVISLARKLRADGLTLSGVGAQLVEAGFGPRTGGQWHPQSIARIVATSAKW